VDANLPDTNVNLEGPGFNGGKTQINLPAARREPSEEG